MDWDSIFKKDTDVKGKSYGWIQWKGTEVCMDIHCVCGYFGHVDTGFFYYFECPNCEKIYAVGQHVLLIELNKEQIEEVKESPCVVKGE